MPDSFYLKVRDPKVQVEKWNIQTGICREVEEAASFRSLSLEGKERVYLVDTKSIHQQACILEYICTPKLKPIPVVRVFLESVMHRKIAFLSLTLNFGSAY